MRKTIWVQALAILFVLFLGACGNSVGQTGDPTAEVLTWQEQYGLGVRYLSEGNYEEAIIAFSVAIEIDSKQAPAYVGRGNAYILSGEAEENLTAALADYETAIELDETYAEAYLGLADIYYYMDDLNRALDVLQLALDKFGELESITEKMSEYNQSQKISIGKFENKETFVEFSKASAMIQNEVSDLVSQVEVNYSWRILYRFLSANEETGMPEFYTEYNGWRIHYQPKNVSGWAPGFLEMRQENGVAYGYDGSTPDQYTTGKTSGWNWDGECKIFIVGALYMEDEMLPGKYIPDGTAGMWIINVVEGKFEGEMLLAEVNEMDNDGDFATAPQHLGTFSNGREIEWRGEDRDVSGEPSEVYSNPAIRVGGDYDTFEDYLKYVVWN